MNVRRNKIQPGRKQLKRTAYPTVSLAGAGRDIFIDDKITINGAVCKGIIDFLHQTGFYGFVNFTLIYRKGHVKETNHM
jgi:hypothetical protein